MRLIQQIALILVLVSTAAADTPHTLSASEAEAALLRLNEIIRQHHALAALHQHDPSDSLEHARRFIRDDMSLNELLLLMQRTLAQIGDGHSEIVMNDRAARDAKRGTDDGRIEHLPFLVKMVGERRGDPVIAIRADREGFVDDAHPVLVAIDGIEIERWLDAIAAFVPNGSPQFVRSRSLRELRSLWRWRLVLGVEAHRDVTVTLASLDGRRRTTMHLRTRTGSPSRGNWPRTSSRMLDGNIGYLRIASMNADDRELDALRRQMNQFRSTRGLIIDVRGNGGGQRRILHLLGEYLIAPDAEPIVYTAVRPRLVDGGETLSPRMIRRMRDRNLYPADAPHWSASQREAIDTFRAGFRPTLQAADDQFGPWHYAVLSAGADQAFHYASPVIVLMDANCFSATDVFLHAVSLLENVTLMGQPSAGSSGAPLSWDSGIPGVSVRVASIVSYRSTGEIFDNGRGEAPDVRIDPAPEFFIGRSDRVLDAAVAQLQRR